MLLFLNNLKILLLNNQIKINHVGSVWGLNIFQPIDGEDDCAPATCPPRWKIGQWGQVRSNIKGCQYNTFYNISFQFNQARIKIRYTSLNEIFVRIYMQI